MPFVDLASGSLPHVERERSLPGHRLAFLSNSWLEGDVWGPFQSSLIDFFRAAVDDLLVVRVNSFFSAWTDAPYSELHLRRFAQVLDDFRPTLVFTVNRAGMAAPVVQQLPPETRIISLFIDYYDRVPEELKRWTERDFVWGTGTGWLRENFMEKYRDTLLREQVEFTLWASDTHRFHPRGLERDIDVLFIGSPLSPEPFADMIEFVAKEHPERLEVFLDVYFEHRRRYIHDIPAELERRGFNVAGVTEQPYREYLNNNWILQAFMSDQISTEARLKYLSALANFKLHVYGEPEGLWIRYISTVNANLLRRYRYRPVKEADELPELYARTKVGLNVQHHHANDVGLSMRVFDIMACGAVLLTHRIAAPPLEELGYREDEHFVAFDGVAECRAKARFLLEDRETRERIADAGCALTHDRHSLQHRLVQVFGKAGYPDLAARFAELTTAAVSAAETPVTYVSDPETIELRPGAKRPLPRTLREVRIAIGRKLPAPLIDLDRRLFGSWFLQILLKHDPERGARPDARSGEQRGQKVR
ncbi:MAG TPA: glycosyltransferase [Gaiellaceae bacterium]|jgi:spore maturation protein CgeB